MFGLPQLPESKAIDRASRPRMQWGDVNMLHSPQQNNRALSGGIRTPRLAKGGICHFDGGGSTGDYGYQPYDASPMAIASPYDLTPPDIGDAGNLTGSPQAGPVASAIASMNGVGIQPSPSLNVPNTDRYNAIIGQSSGSYNPGSLTQNPDGSVTFSTSQNPTSGGNTGFGGWLQNKHAGITGANWLKAGLTALTGILSGYASKKANQGRIPVNGLSGGNPLGMCEGGAVKMAQGGICCMADGGLSPAEQQMSQIDPSDQQNQVIVMNAVKALLGQSQSPEQDLQAFVAHYGQNALAQLAQRIQMSGGQGAPMQQQPVQQATGGGILSGAGDGTSDNIPARLSSGEYVLDAPTVSAIGNGSTEAGAKKLDAARMALRMKKHGTPHQPPTIKDAHNPVLNALGT